MTKKLEETFGLPPAKKATEALKKSRVVKKEVAKTVAVAIISEEDLEDHDEKMDTYADEAHEYAKDIMDLGMGTEPRHSADMFNAAANMMKVALEAKNSKLDKKIRLYDLELKKQRINIEKSKIAGDINFHDDGSVYTSREDILSDNEN